MTSITPLEHRIVSFIQEHGKSEVNNLSNTLELDRGKLEGSLANLESKNFIRRHKNKQEKIKLSERGKIAAKSLAERVILDYLLENSEVSMKEIGDKINLDRSDLTAGIGILRKSKLISIDKGIISITDQEQAKDFAKDISETLSKILQGKDVGDINENLKNSLMRRGLIEIIETTKVEVETNLSTKQAKQLKILKEVSKLTPQMLSNGSWREVAFKPYSMSTKPRRIYAGRYNPYRQFLDHLRTKLIGLGFQEMKGPLIEQEFWNFDALYAPQDHASREDSDILLVNNPSHGTLENQDYVKYVSKTHENGWKTGSLGHRYKWDPKKAARLLLRPQGTSVSVRTLAKVEQPPAKYFSIARCFRPDHIDATHDVEFDQTEGIILDESITFRDLLGMLETFAIEVAGASKVRFRPDFYPFTSPSVELSAEHPVLGHIEFGGAGIFRPEVTQPFGIDYPVLAWGLGVGRLFMTKYHISDIRELFSQNLDWLRDEKVASGIQPE